MESTCTACDSTKIIPNIEIETRAQPGLANVSTTSEVHYISGKGSRHRYNADSHNQDVIEFASVVSRKCGNLFVVLASESSNDQGGSDNASCSFNFVNS